MRMMTLTLKTNLSKITALVMIVVIFSLTLSGCVKTDNQAGNQKNIDAPNEPIKKVWTKDIGVGAIETKVFANNGFIYASNKLGTMFCIDEKSKEIVWKKEKYPDFTWLDFSEGKIFFGSSDFNFYCMDRKTGDIIWVYEANGGVFSKAAFMKEYVYFGTSGKTLYCLETKSGKLAWKFEAKAGIAARPVISGGHVVFGSQDGSLYCCNGLNGKLYWTKKLNEPITNDFAVIDKNIVVGSGTKLHCLDIKDGRSLWTKDLKSRLLNSVTIFNGYIFCQTYISLVCLEKDGETIWKTDIKGNNKFESFFDRETLIVDANGVIVINKSAVESYSLRNGKRFWRFKYSFYRGSYPTHCSDSLYMVSDSSGIECIGTLTGEALWSIKTNAGEQFWILGNGEILIDFQTTEYPSDNPEVSDSHIEHSLACFDQKGEQKLWSAKGFINVAVIDGRIFCQTDSKNILGINPETGLQEWLCKINKDINFWDLKLDGYLLCFASKMPENDNREEFSSSIILNCIDLITGKLIWFVKMPHLVDVYMLPINNDWHISNGNVFYSDTNGITCLDATSGKTLWVHEMPVQSYLHFSCVDNHLFVGSINDYDYSLEKEIPGSVICLDVLTGKLLWKTESGCDSEMLVAKSTVSFTSGKSYCCYDIGKGTLLWKKEYEVLDYLYVHSYVFDESIVIMHDNDEIMSFDLLTGSLNWSRDNSFGMYPYVYIYKDWAVFVGKKWKISLLNLHTGMVDYSEEIKTRFISNVCFLDGTFFVSTDDCMERYTIDFDNLKRTFPNITLQVDNPMLTIDGVGIDAGFEPVMFGDEVYVLPEMFELAFGFLVNNDEESAIISISDGKRKVSISSNSQATKSGSVVNEIELNTIIINGKVYAPLIKTCAFFAANVRYDKNTRVVEVAWPEDG